MIIKNNYEISFLDKERDIIQYLIRLSDDPGITLDNVLNYIQKAQNTLYFIDRNLYSYPDNSSDQIEWMLMETGLKSAISGDPLFISLIKQRNSGIYEGYFVGDPQRLFGNMANFLGKNTEEGNKAAKRFLDKLEGKTLPVKKEQASEPSKKFFNKVTEDSPFDDEFECDYFLHMAGLRIGDIKKNGEEQNEVIFKGSTSAIINTGFQDDYGFDILVCYKGSVDNKWHPYAMIESKGDAMRQGFSKEQANTKLEPLSFGKTKELPDGLTEDDFDLPAKTVAHIIEDRIYRLPETIRHWTKKDLGLTLKESFEESVKEALSGHRKASPLYSGNGKISFAFPATIGKSEKTEFAFIVYEDDFGVYTARTILNMDRKLELREKMLTAKQDEKGE